MRLTRSKLLCCAETCLNELCALAEPASGLKSHLLIVGTSLLIGLVLQKVEVVFGFTGAVASTVLSYCLPAAIHLRLSPHPARALRRTWRPAAFLLAGGLLGLTSFVNHAIDTLSSAQPGDGEPEKCNGSGQQNCVGYFIMLPEERFALARNPGCLSGVL